MCTHVYKNFWVIYSCLKITGVKAQMIWNRFLNIIVQFRNVSKCCFCLLKHLFLWGVVYTFISRHLVQNDSIKAMRQQLRCIIFRNENTLCSKLRHIRQLSSSFMTSNSLFPKKSLKKILANKTCACFEIYLTIEYITINFLN